MTLRIPYAPLKVVFFIHLTLIVGSSNSLWLPATYLFYNALLLLTMLWTIHSRDSEEGPFMGICINMVSIVFDIVTFCSYWSTTAAGGARWLACLCAVANLFVRPVSSFIMYRILSDRAATYGNYTLPAGLDNIFPTNIGSNRSPYEDIDQSVNPQTLGPQITDPMMSPSHQPQQPYQAKAGDQIGFDS